VLDGGRTIRGERLSRERLLLGARRGGGEDRTGAEHPGGAGEKDDDGDEGEGLLF
jgi:hypothetical protein